MAEKKVIELEIKDNVSSLKSQLRQATAEVALMAEKFGATSKEAADAAKRAAELKDMIADAKDLTDAFNPDAKFNALSSSIGGVLNGFQAYEGALGLIGVESKALQETMLKVQSAMALSQGIQGIMEAKDNFIQLGSVIKNTSIAQKIMAGTTAVLSFVTGASTTALKLFRIALISTGIGAIVVGLGLLIANFDTVTKYVTKAYDWFSKLGTSFKIAISIMFPFIGVIYGVIKALEYFGIIDDKEERDRAERHKRDSARAEEKLKKQEELNRKKERAYNDEQKLIDRQIKMAEAEGKSTEELQKKKIRASIAYQKTKLGELEVENQILKTIIKQSGVVGEMYSELLIENENLISETKNNISDLENDLKIIDIKSKNEAIKRKAESVKENKKQDVDYSDWLKENQRQLDDALNKLSKKNRDKAREDRDKNLKDDIDEITRNTKGKLEAENFALKDGSKQLLQNKKDLLYLEKEAELSNKELTEGEKLAIEAKYKKATEDLDKDYNEKQLAREDQIRKARFQMAYDTLNLISNITELFGRRNEKQARIAFGIDKAAKLASATIAGIEGTIEAYKTAQKSPITAVFPVYPIVQAGLAGAFAATNIAKIAQTQFNANGSSVSSTTPSGGQSYTPQFNVVGSSGVNQLAQVQQQPVKAYITSGDVVSAMSLERNKLQKTSI